MHIIHKLGFSLKSMEDGIFATSEKYPNIRVKKVSYRDWEIGDFVQDYLFEIYTKPFWFGFLRKKRWEMSVQTNDFQRGLDFSCYILKQ